MTLYFYSHSYSIFKKVFPNLTLTLESSLCSMLHMTYWFSWQSYSKIIVLLMNILGQWTLKFLWCNFKILVFFFSWSWSLYLVWIPSWVQAWHPCSMIVMLCVNNHVFEVCMVRLLVCVSSPHAIMGWIIWPKVWLNAPITNKSLTW